MGYQCCRSKVDWLLVISVLSVENNSATVVLHLRPREKEIRRKQNTIAGTSLKRYYSKDAAATLIITKLLDTGVLVVEGRSEKIKGGFKQVFVISG